MTDLTPAAVALDRLLTGRRRPALGAFLPAGFPNWTAGIEALRAFARHGADFLEIGVPHRSPAFDGPVITAAYSQALDQGARMPHLFSTVRLAVSTTGVPVVVVSYWNPVVQFGVESFTRSLAQVGAAGAMIPDLPEAQAESWHAAATASGLHTPRFTPRQIDDPALERVASTASGWVYAPAADALTGFQGDLDIPGLHRFTTRLRQHIDLPVVAGIGVSTPLHAAHVAPYVDAVVIGSPLVRPLLDHPGRGGGLSQALERIEDFAGALRAPAAFHALPA
ncbi:tryptophan synthase subunit alpha [Streptomyces europaeiscabiei]|uniref:tryptophan synthase subunit alpha n=1 Tax=Streptomyces europaeiscabiei TaxID=146819 RepID=UPI0029A7E6EB|nr:tryptophan synthase subunit alpha [Streptomyces europaeiscabiei]MDX3694898.1 tryptophan synthase subunit alpha [Streptomyces europaeiscabiei]